MDSVVLILIAMQRQTMRLSSVCSDDLFVCLTGWVVGWSIEAEFSETVGFIRSTYRLYKIYMN